jgi:hypothetical protein
LQAGSEKVCIRHFISGYQILKAIRRAQFRDLTGKCFPIGPSTAIASLRAPINLSFTAISKR